MQNGSFILVKERFDTETMRVLHWRYGGLILAEKLLKSRDATIQQPGKRASAHFLG